MSLKCSNTGCQIFELASAEQLAFYQDVNNGGWNLGLSPNFVISENKLPPNIRLVETTDPRFPYYVKCARCMGNVGKVNKICGFDQLTVNFSSSNTNLLQHPSRPRPGGAQKWGKIHTLFPQIKKIVATPKTTEPIVGIPTVHFKRLSDLQLMIEYGKAVSVRSNMDPRRYQWRSYFFSCMNNTLLCLATGMGKTLVANMLMYAYRQRNPDKGQVFVVPTIVLVDQQAEMIERNTGMKVERRSGDHQKEKPWEAKDICVCTYAIVVNAIRMKEIDASQLSLVVLDEVHDANSANSTYGQLLPLITKCQQAHRPRILGLSASPSGVNSVNMRENISSLCTKLCAVPFSPLVDDEKNKDKANKISCKYVPIYKTAFEVRFEDFVINSIHRLAELHKYYIKNYKSSPPNISIKQRIDKVVKILNQATLIAKNDKDLTLFHLTQWIRKWIDSLDMLQIFGPQKLLEFIRADLEYARRNGELSSISVQLAPILLTMELTIEEIEDNYSIVEDSTRVRELVHQVKIHQTDQVRILIFVERRTTAERLCRRLKDDPDIAKMNPDFVVGNADNGMPKEIQQAILHNFHDGKCQVLVATSVLEQGIDVAACGMVIRFDGVTSMKSIIQSRGRARMQFAKFIVFVSDDEKKRENELTVMEASMNLAIQQLMYEKKIGFEEQINLEINKFLESDHENHFVASPVIEDEDEDDEDEEVPKVNEVFHLIFFNFKNSENLANHIRQEFKSKYDRLKVTRKRITARFVIPENNNDAIVNIVKNISSLNGNNSNLQSWFEVIKPISDTSSKHNMIENLEMTFSSLTGFYFVNPTKVSIEQNPIWNKLFNLQFDHNEIKMINDKSHFSIRIIDIEGPILINEQRNSLKVFLCLRNPPYYFLNNERGCFDFSNRSFNLCLRLNAPTDPTASWKLRQALLNLSPKVINVCHLVEKNFDEESLLEPTRFSDSEKFQRDYLIKSWHSKHAAVLPPKLPNQIISQLNKPSLPTLEMLLHNTSPVRFERLEIQQVEDIELPFSEWDPPATYAMFPRIKVTPSRIVFMPKQPVTKNRVFRYFPNPENFLLVSFTDEHDDNPWKSEHVCNRFFNVLLHGIQIGGKCFTFLGCSNSQLRIGRCWFSCLDRQTIYDKIGDFPNEWSAGRKLTRIALAFASSIETVAVNHERYLKCVSPDVTRGDIKFSDGIGRASPRLMSQIQTKMNIPQKISAFQIRVGGIKGVISEYDKQTEDVMFRKSMKKFESKHNIIEVLNYSRSTELYLNRHVILLLSENGIANEVFLRLQHEELLGSLKALMEDEMALAFVKSRSKIFKWELLRDARITRDPFFRQLLMSNATELVQQIVENARVKVPNGRVLMGVMDETGTLEYGEVYANIIEDDFSMELEGRVLVFRNPCVLPSDIRVLNACKKERLKKIYRNCLVIPSKGPSSHAAECAGGDLDGDLYYVIWDKDLVPNFAVPGRDVIENPTKEISSLNSGNSDVDMMKFYCDYVSKNQLGIIANAHLATADRLGMDHVQTIQLAKYVAAETDAPKKGLTVGIIDAKLLPSEYPDYMQKLDKPSYRSESVLGEMFRHAKPLLDVLLEKRKPITPPRPVTFSTNDSIEQHYSQYAFEINKLLMSFDLESEVDLFSGTPIWRKGYMSAFKQQTQHRLNVNELVKAFWLKWENIFEEWRIKVLNEQEQQKINDWFIYPNQNVYPVHSFSYLAMPFVDFKEKERWSMSQAIQDSSSIWVKINRVYWLDEWRKRIQVGEALKEKLNGIECHYYGSSMLGLNEDYSDVDVYAAEKNFEKLCNSLKAIDENVFSQQKPHKCVSLTLHSLPVDVTNFVEGVQETYGLAELFDEQPELWGALRVLIEWARTSHIVKSSGVQGIMPVISFCHLFIYFATNLLPRVTNKPKPYTVARLDKWIDAVRYLKVGNLVYDFLTFISDRENHSYIVNKTDPLSGDKLIKSDLVKDLRKNAEIALYFLAIHDGDVQKLFQLCSKKRLFRIDKRYMNPNSNNIEKSRQCFREIKSKCNPLKNKELTLSLLERNGVFFLKAEGDHKLFSDVERGLNQIHTRINSVRIKGLSRSFHVKNGTIILPEFYNKMSTEVSFSPYTSDLYLPQHTDIYKSILVVRNVERNLNWMKECALRYQKRFREQIELYRKKQQSVKKGQKSWRFFGEFECNIRLGNHYLFNIPESLTKTFETISLQRVESNISYLEEAFDAENRQAMVQEMKNYNTSTLMKPVVRNEVAEPLLLMPIADMKRKTDQQNKAMAPVPIVQKKILSGIRHSFAPNWSHGSANVCKFASLNAFKKIPFTPNDYYINITVFWRQRELVVSCNNRGIIQGIGHRKTRWLSATMKQADQDVGDDIRFYLECRAMLDDDESILETIVDVLRGQSVFNADFMTEVDEMVDGEKLSKKPLISKMMQFNWRFRSMRFISPELKFMNPDGDILLLQRVCDGVFRAEACEFEWFPKHYELEIRMNMKNRSDIELGEKSYELGSKLFNFTKTLSK